MLNGFAFRETRRMRKGILFAAAAYLLWGLFPIYFRALAAVPAPEMLAHRGVWSVLFLGLLVAHGQRWAWLGAALRQPRLLRACASCNGWRSRSPGSGSAGWSGTATAFPGSASCWR